MGKKKPEKEGAPSKIYGFLLLILFNILEHTTSLELYIFDSIWANSKNGPKLSLCCEEKQGKIRKNKKLNSKLWYFSTIHLIVKAIESNREKRRGLGSVM